MLDITRAYALTFLIAQNDMGIGRILRERGEFARVESELIIDYLKVEPSGAYLDIGANIGTIALPVAAACPRIRVIAIEAQRVVAGILAANALNNHLYNVDVIHAAAGATSSLMAFPQGRLDDGQLNFGLVGAHVDVIRSENVRVCTLDEIAPADTRFVKIDVEGFESEVLKGSGRLIRDIKPAWLLEADRKKMEHTRATMRTMSDAGYRLFWFYAPLESPASTKLPRVAQNSDGDMNFLALPPHAPNLWNLQELTDVEEEPPVRLSDFPYLDRVKFKLQPRGENT